MISAVRYDRQGRKAGCGSANCNASSFVCPPGWNGKSDAGCIADDEVHDALLQVDIMQALACATGRLACITTRLGLKVLA